MELLKIDLYDEEIFAFTPLGDLIRLPAGSTTVDFAFQVHTQVGMHCIGAKINHLVVPLNTKIKNGDIVEILTSKKQSPSIGWHKFVVTTKARNEINGLNFNQAKNHPYHQQNHLTSLLHCLIQKLGIAYRNLV